jgi:predicted negative regulator of RcsB-dependent stress response
MAKYFRLAVVAILAGYAAYRYWQDRQLPARQRWAEGTDPVE